MPKPARWHNAVMLESFLGFSKGSKIKVRLAVTKRPLAVGPVYILFDGTRSIRVVSELSGMFRTAGACDVSEAVTRAYRRYLERNPPGQRYTEQEYLFD
jgi:hypothetical protein